MAHSFSTLRDFDLCPLRYSLKHVVGLSEPSGTFARVGNLVAELMSNERYALVEGVEMPESEERRALADKFAGKYGASEEEAAQAHAIVDSALGAMPDLMPAPMSIARYLIEIGVAFDKDLKRIGTDWDNDAYYTGADWATAFFKCRVDFAWSNHEGVLHVEDDKSGWNEADPKQLLAYAWCVREGMRQKGQPEPKGFKLTFNYLGMKRRVEVSAAEIDTFPAWLKAKHAEIEAAKAADDFPPRLGKACDWCGFVADCPLHAKVKDQLATIDPAKFRGVTSVDQAVAGGLWLMSAEKVIAAAKEQLKAFVQVNGPVPLADTGMVLEIRTSEPPRHASAGDVIEQLIEAGIPKREFYSRIQLSGNDVDDVLAGVYPLGGKGVDRQVKAHNLAQRKAVYEALDAVWKVGKPRHVLDIYRAKEGAE